MSFNIVTRYKDLERGQATGLACNPRKKYASPLMGQATGVCAHSLKLFYLVGIPTTL